MLLTHSANEGLGYNIAPAETIGSQNTNPDQIPMLTAACTANMLPIISSIKNEALVSIQISESARIPEMDNNIHQI